jgi:hypothetical protein
MWKSYSPETVTRYIPGAKVASLTWDLLCELHNAQCVPTEQLLLLSDALEKK